MPLDFLKKKKSLPPAFLRGKAWGETRPEKLKELEPKKPTFKEQQPTEEDYTRGIDPKLAMHLRLRGRESEMEGLKPTYEAGWAKGKAVKAVSPYLAGTGDVISSTGTALKWVGFKKTGEKLRQYGAKTGEEFTDQEAMERLGEFDWRDTLDPEFYHHKGLRIVPQLVALAPAAILGYMAGAPVGGAVAAKTGFGVFGKAVIKYIFGMTASSTFSAIAEGSIEAGQTYEEMLQKTGDEEISKKAGNEVFFRNVKMLTAMNLPEFAMTFLPTKKIPFAKSLKLLKKGVVRIPAKMAVVGEMEAFEEEKQIQFHKEAMGEKFERDAPETKEARFLGRLVGMGTAGAGDVFVNLQNKVIKSLSEKAKSDFEKAKASELQKGFEEPVAQLNALDKITVKHKGAVKEAVKVRIDEIKAEGEPAPVVTEPQVVKREKEEENILVDLSDHNTVDGALNFIYLKDNNKIKKGDNVSVTFDVGGTKVTEKGTVISFYGGDIKTYTQNEKKQYVPTGFISLDMPGKRVKEIRGDSIINIKQEIPKVEGPKAIPDELAVEAKKIDNVKSFLNKQGIKTTVGDSKFDVDRILGENIVLKQNNAIANIWLKETNNEVWLNTIKAEKSGSGIGTKIINELKNYSDITGKKLVIPNITNKEYFDKLSWLKDDFTTKYRNTRSYKSKATKAVKEIKPIAKAIPDELISHEGAPDKKRVEEYKKKIQAGETVEPLKIIKEDDKFGIEDGKHRFEAYKQLGIKNIPVEIVEPRIITKKPKPTITREKPVVSRQIALTTDFDIKQPKSENYKKAEYESNVLTELEVAEKGERMPIKDEQGYTTGWTGVKSTFPAWIPDGLRSKKLINTVLEHIKNKTVPAKADEIRLYNTIADKMEDYKEVAAEIDKEINVDEIDFMAGKEKDKQLINNKVKIYEQEKSNVIKEIRDSESKIDEVKTPAKQVPEQKDIFGKGVKLEAKKEQEAMVLAPERKAMENKIAGKPITSEEFKEAKAKEITEAKKGQAKITPEIEKLKKREIELEDIIEDTEGMATKEEIELGQVRKKIREQTKPTMKKVSGYADTGGYADIPVHNSDLKEGGITSYEFNHQKRISDIVGKVKGIEMPELVRMYKELTNAVKLTLKDYKSALGKFYAIPEKYNIKLNRELFVRKKVEDKTTETGFRMETDKEMHDRIAKTMAHELGHLVDFLPDEVMTRGNILGRLFVLSKFRGEFLGKPEVIAKRKKVMQKIGYRKQLIKKGKKTATTKEELKALEQELIELSEKLTFKQPFQDELIKLTQIWKPFDETAVPEWFVKYRYAAPELYADFMSALFTRPDIAKQYAPKFYETWFKNIDKKPQFKKAYFELQLMLHGERKHLVKQRYEDLLNMFKKSDEIYKQQLIERVSHKNNFWYEIKKQFIYIHQWAIDYSKGYKQLLEKNEDIDPKYFMEEDDLIGSSVYAGIIKDIAPIKTELQDAGLSWNELSALLFVERVSKSGSREGIANPLGHSVQSTQEIRDYIYKMETDKKKAMVLFNSARKLRKALQNAMIKYPDLYSPEMLEKIKSDSFYAPFNIIYKVFNKLPAGLQHQTGNLNETNNIANNVVLKYIGVIYSGEKNIITTKTAKMVKHTDGNIKEADYIMTGKKVIRINGEKKTIVTRKPKEPDDIKLGLITTMEKGKLKGYYVPKNIADSFKYDPVKTQNLILHYAFVLPNKYFFKPVYTTLSLGFQMVNFLFRDLMGFKKIPTMNWIKLFKEYKEALPHAYRKAWGKYDKDINIMFEKKLLSTHNSGKYRFAESVEARSKEGMDYILQMAGLDNMKGKYDNVPVLKQAKGVIDFMQKVGDMLEATPKIAGYKYLKDNKIFANDKITEHWVRANVGSPNFFKLSGQHALLNNISLFYNAVVRGWERTYETATYKQSKSAFWWHMAKYAVIPAVLTVAAEEGIFGDEVEKQMKKISEYMKNNYVVTPIKISDKLNKVVFMSLPMAEEDRLIHAITRIALRGAMGDLKNKGKAAFDVASYTGGQVPGFAPTIELGLGWITYLTGGNPYDMFRDQHIFLASEEKAGHKIKAPIMIKWTLNKSGLIKFELHDRATNSTLGEAVIKNTPILHRFLRISNFGEYEADQIVKNREGAKEATESVLFDRRVVKAVNDYWKETPDDIGAYAMKVMPEVLGEEATKKNYDKFKRLFKRYIISGLNNAHLNSLSSGTTRQKVALLIDLKKNLAPDDFNKLIQMGISTKTLSETVMKKYLIKINQENANKAFK